MPSPTVAARLDSLTGIRTIAVFLVFWHHASEFGEGAPSSGMVGVSLFYLVSGFVMAWTDRENDTAWLFYRRRFARIYPAYFVAVTMAVVILVAGGDFAPVDLAAYTLLQSWAPDPAVHFAANVVFWSLSCEVFFYLAFPALRQVTRRLSVRGIWTLSVSAAVISLSIAAVGSVFTPTDMVTWAVVVLPLSRFPEFVIGACMGTLLARGWRPRLPVWFAFALAAASVGVALLAPYALSRYAVTLIPFTLLIVALASADLRGLRLFTQWRWMVQVGVWSYCFYLLHLMVLAQVIRLTNIASMPLWVGLALSAILSVALSWLLHVVVERPAERYLRPTGRPRLDTEGSVSATKAGQF